MCAVTIRTRFRIFSADQDPRKTNQRGFMRIRNNILSGKSFHLKFFREAFFFSYGYLQIIISAVYHVMVLKGLHLINHFRPESTFFFSLNWMCIFCF
jgi:hypothetical protein